MKKILLALFLTIGYTGCSTVKEAPESLRYCLKYASYETVESECTGGRGVAPLMCVDKVVTKTYCVKWETL